MVCNIIKSQSQVSNHFRLVSTMNTGLNRRFNAQFGKLSEIVYQSPALKNTPLGLASVVYTGPNNKGVLVFIYTYSNP